MGDQHPDRPLRDEYAENRAASGEQQALRKQLTNDAPAGAAKGIAYGEFVMASGHAGELDIGNISAGDEENESDGAEQHEGVLARKRAGHEAGQGHGLKNPAFVGIGISFGLALLDALHLSRGMFERDTGLEVAEDPDPAMIAAFALRVFDVERKPSFRGHRKVVALAHHA